MQQAEVKGALVGCLTQPGESHGMPPVGDDLAQGRDVVASSNPDDVEARTL